MKFRTRNPFVIKLLQLLGIKLKPVITIYFLDRDWEISSLITILEQTNPVIRLMAKTGKTEQEIEDEIKKLLPQLKVYAQSMQIKN